MNTSGPPPSKRQFGSRDERISYLANKLIHWINVPNWSRSRHFANLLAQEVSEPNVHKIKVLLESEGNFGKIIDAIWNLGNWVLIYEGRRDIESTIEFENLIIGLELNLLEKYYTQSEWSTPAFRRDVTAILDAYEIQSRRFLIMNEDKLARSAMEKAKAVSQKYHVPLDDGQLALFRQLIDPN